MLLKDIKLRSGDTSRRRRPGRRSVWGTARRISASCVEIVVNIEHTKPGTALDDHLRKEQTRALLELLADYVQKLDKSGDAEP